MATPTHWLDEIELADEARNVVAFLDMLAHAEGAGRFGDELGYNVLVGGKLFSSYDDHPRQSVYLPAYNIRSTAAGRYQFLARTWDDLVDRFGLSDFTPPSQDEGAVRLIAQCDALDDVKAGRVSSAIQKCRKIWASLPGAGYGQREVREATLIDVYRRAGGRVA